MDNEVILIDGVEYWTVAKYAREIGCTSNNFYNFLGKEEKLGKIKGFKLGGRWLLEAGSYLRKWDRSKNSKENKPNFLLKDKSIDELDLPEFVTKWLKSGNINTIDDLISKNNKYLISLPNYQKSYINNIISKLDSLGIKHKFKRIY